jgi:endothelin-converting enzyme
MSEVDSALGHILGGVFISRMFSKKDKQLGDQVIQDVKDVFAENLKTLDWMSALSKEVAARKGESALAIISPVHSANKLTVANIISKIGYQTKNPNEEKPQELSDYYAKLTITENYFNNARAYAMFTQNQTWSDLLKPTDRDRWEMTCKIPRMSFGTQC